MMRGKPSVERGERGLSHQTGNIPLTGRSKLLTLKLRRQALIWVTVLL